MTTAAVGCARQFCHILAMKIAMALDTIAAGDRGMDASDIEMDVIVALDTGGSHIRTSDIRFMRRMAGAAFRQFISGVLRIDKR